MLLVILTNSEAVILISMFTSPALAIVREVSGVPPTAPLKSMIPAPAVRVRGMAPVRALLKVILLPLEFKETALEDRVVTPVMERPS